ncbi:putative diverged CheY-domain [Salisediminibacterium beveridgei]|uniref:Putative diverged CheY-domain n=2 Tax=Salisediminibacterium beveridgei TaxID=632773 RepID=A0A1D7QXH0_9BACI|nr:putative diverged CheY-domain [Salisediminibacterium beveridgei]
MSGGMTMSSLMVIGGDQLGNIPDKLKALGFDDVLHISGRKTQMVKRDIPEGVDLILVLTDFINHNIAKKIKAKASKQNIPICYSKRSWCTIYQTLNTNQDACRTCPFLKEGNCHLN